MKPIAPTGQTNADPLDRERIELRRAAEAFEALLVQSLIKKMREAQLDGGLFGKTAGSSVYDSMFDQHLAQALAAGSTLGIADLLEERWSGSLEGREGPRGPGAAAGSASSEEPIPRETRPPELKIPGSRPISEVIAPVGDDSGKRETP